MSDNMLIAFIAFLDTSQSFDDFIADNLAKPGL